MSCINPLRLVYNVRFSCVKAANSLGKPIVFLEKEERTMMDTPSGDQMERAPEIATGTSVFDATGNKVGEVASPNTTGDYFVVEKGFIFTHQIFIPMSAVRYQDLNGIYLSLSKDDLKGDQWKEPPTGGLGAETASPVVPPEAGVGGLGTPLMPGPITNPYPEEEPPLAQR